MLPTGNTQERIIGNNAGTRTLNPTKRGEPQRFQRTDSASDDSNMEGKSVSLEENTIFMQKAQRGEIFCYAVSGSQIHVHSDEIGKFQGYVYVYKPDKEFSTWLKENKLVDDQSQTPYRSLDIVEMSYSRDPRAKKHQMGAGVRAVIYKLSQMNAAIDEARESHFGRTLIHREKWGLDEAPRVPIVVRIVPDDESSLNVAKSAGFEKAGSFEGEDVMVLHWNRFDTIMKQKRNRELTDGTRDYLTQISIEDAPLFSYE